MIETLAGKHMDHYGYEKMTKGAAEITSQKIAAAKSHSEKNKKLAWDALKTTDYRDYRLRLFRSDYIQTVKKRLIEDKRNSRADWERKSIAEPSFR